MEPIDGDLPLGQLTDVNAHARSRYFSV
jgi:hypothetical protein